MYFAVVDADAAAARAGEPGGTILVPPRDIPAGRYAGLRDPQGAFFNVIALARTGTGWQPSAVGPARAVPPRVARAEEAKPKP